MVTHPPFVHITLGILVLSFILISVEGILFLLKKPDYFEQLKNRAEELGFITLIIGFFSIFITGFFGLLDASLMNTSNILDFSIPLKGLERVLQDDLLFHKLKWTFLALNFYLLSIIIFLMSYRKKIYLHNNINVYILYNIISEVELIPCRWAILKS